VWEISESGKLVNVILNSFMMWINATKRSWKHCSSQHLTLFSDQHVVCTNDKHTLTFLKSMVNGLRTYHLHEFSVTLYQLQPSVNFEIWLDCACDLNKYHTHNWQLDQLRIIFCTSILPHRTLDTLLACIYPKSCSIRNLKLSIGKEHLSYKI
jgi:hypothetical protein